MRFFTGEPSALKNVTIFAPFFTGCAERKAALDIVLAESVARWCDSSSFVLATSGKMARMKASRSTQAEKAFKYWFLVILVFVNLIETGCL